MISKAKLKSRLIDICNGAGMEWQDKHDYFEFHDDNLACVGNALQAIERAFELGENKRLRSPFRLKDFNDIDSLTDLVHECIEFDTSND